MHAGTATMSEQAMAAIVDGGKCEAREGKIDEEMASLDRSLMSPVKLAVFRSGIRARIGWRRRMDCFCGFQDSFELDSSPSGWVPQPGSDSTNILPTHSFPNVFRTVWKKLPNASLDGYSL